MLFRLFSFFFFLFFLSINLIVRQPHTNSRFRRFSFQYFSVIFFFVVVCSPMNVLMIACSMAILSMFDRFTLCVHFHRSRPIQVQTNYKQANIPIASCNVSQFVFLFIIQKDNKFFVIVVRFPFQQIENMSQCDI